MAEPALSQGYGYGFVLGLGIGLGIFMAGVTVLEKRYLHVNQESSESYLSADRSIKSGLIASAVVSSWTWAATLLQSTSVAYIYGVSGPFWYASCGTVVILLFSVLAIELKRVAPNAHTFLEIVRVRYGKVPHIVYICFGLTTNLLVTSMLLLGGSSTITYLTGMDVNAACMLLPLGVILYTSFGGIKSTFLMDYLHTVILFVVIIIFAMTTYANNPIIGSIEKMYTLLQNAGKVQPADGNRNGEYLTMASTGGIEFGVITLVQGFGTVFVDNAYWQRGIAAHPRYAVQGYLAGGLAWYAIPFATATTLGLAGRALLIDIAEIDVSAGLVLPQVAVLLLGQSGAVMALLVVFMAVTSALSAEMIAVSSIGTYDIYQAYINPEATNKQIKLSADTLIVSYGIFSGILAIILNNIGITIGYLYNLTGLMISSAVAPLICTLMWKKQNLLAVTIAPLMGTGCGFISWLVTSHILYNEITITSTIKNFPILAGNLTSILLPIPVVYFISIMNPANFDFAETKFNIKLLDLETDPTSTKTESESQCMKEPDMTEDELLTASKFAKASSLILTFTLLILWPLPLFFSDYIFSLVFFRGWVVFVIMWLWASAAFILLYPLIESRASLLFVFKYMWKDTKAYFMNKEDKFDDIPKPIIGSGEKVDELGGTAHVSPDTSTHV